MKAHVWTNFFYILAGLACYILNAPLYVFYAFATLGILSWYSHEASERIQGELIWYPDHFGMYIAFSAIISHVSGVPELGILALGCSFIIHFALNMYITVGFLFALSFTFFGINHSLWQTALIGLLFGGGLLLQRLGHSNRKLNNILHSGWHLLTAIAMSLMILL